MICTESAFFKAACEENWQSGMTNTVELAEDDPTIVSLFLTWLATDIKLAIDYVAHTREGSDDEQLARLKVQFRQLAGCYIFGDKVQALDFCNYIMDWILFVCSEISELHDCLTPFWVDNCDISYGFCNTVESSPLRLRVINIFLCLTILSKESK